jgi:agmatine/peptidylarginine deiminase
LSTSGKSGPGAGKGDLRADESCLHMENRHLKMDKSGFRMRNSGLEAKRVLYMVGYLVGNKASEVKKDLFISGK